MKRVKLVSIFLSLFTVILCSAFVFTSCDYIGHVHNYSNEWIKDATYHWQSCSWCEEMRYKAEHDWNSGVVTLQPTNTSEGVRTYTCNACGHTRIEGIPVLNTHEHTFSNEWSSNDTHHWHAAVCEHSSEK